MVNNVKEKNPLSHHYLEKRRIKMIYDFTLKTGK